MHSYIDERAERIGSYIAESGQTVRNAAKLFAVSKSTVHKDITHRLRHINPALYARVQAVLDKNKAERHIRGGEATHRKYKSAAL